MVAHEIFKCIYCKQFAWLMISGLRPLLTKVTEKYRPYLSYLSTKQILARAGLLQLKPENRRVVSRRLNIDVIVSHSVNKLSSIQETRAETMHEMIFKRSGGPHYSCFMFLQGAMVATSQSASRCAEQGKSIHIYSLLYYALLIGMARRSLLRGASCRMAVHHCTSSP